MTARRPPPHRRRPGPFDKFNKAARGTYRRPPQPHQYLPDPQVPADHRGDRSCTVCGTPAGNRMHVEDAQAADAAAQERRRLGERD